MNSGGLQRVLDESEVRAVIDRAVAAGGEVYVQDCEARVKDFIRRHYSFRGALKIHMHAIGWDVLRMPLNIIWSVVNIVLALVGFIVGLLGLGKVQQWIRKIPPGLETDMDRQISWLIVTELLELPFEQGHKVSNNDALMTEILKDPELRLLLNEVLDAFVTPSHSPEFRGNLEAKLAEYGATRMASSDLASNAALLVTSKIALGQASFGTLSAGAMVSASVANSAAVSNFWLGSTVGSYYYAIFPVAASVRLLFAVTALSQLLLRWCQHL